MIKQYKLTAAEHTAGRDDSDDYNYNLSINSDGSWSYTCIHRSVEYWGGGGGSDDTTTTTSSGTWQVQNGEMQFSGKTQTREENNGSYMGDPPAPKNTCSEFATVAVSVRDLQSRQAKFHGMVLNSSEVPDFIKAL
eukprot:TRINITY_DN77165_c0_g1_i1.p1 TRINITY_DN77165_c0_g1~~TRINITY_DN77165_c0_g1_i1.p1  ORF type:complete len:136 (-),score=10.08 TRINITY_DN77165_c0_g1_i1:218-625(-)